MFINHKSLLAIAFYGAFFSGVSYANPEYPTETEIQDLNLNIPSAFAELLSDNDRVIAKFDTSYGLVGYVIETGSNDIIIFYDPDQMIAFSGVLMVDGKMINEHYIETEIPEK